jgi:hypothetical protein
MKKYLSGILAILLAVALSAFTTKKNANFIHDKFVFVGNVKVQAQVMDNKNWIYFGQGQYPENWQLTCEPGTLVCSASGAVNSAGDLAVLDDNNNYSLSPIIIIFAPTGNTISGYVAQFSQAIYVIESQLSELSE